MKRHKNILYTLCFVLAVIYSPVQAKVTASVEPKRAEMGETIRLTLTLDDPKAQGIPDLTPLQKQFTIIGTERSMSYTLINGQAQSMYRWLILLTPKQTGSLTIPAIEIAQQTSKPLTIEVEQAAARKLDGAKAGQTHDEVMIKAQVTQPKPYVNQQVIYTVKLYNRGRLMDAEYRAPSVEDALMLTLGDAKRYTTVVNGQEYSVEEQQYAIYPQKSGPLTIKPPSFYALLYDRLPKRIKVEAEPVKLEVQTIPPQYLDKHWLPAQDVRLAEQYSKELKPLHQGDTLERQITLQATGVPAQLLPKLEFPSETQLGVYPEKPDEQNVMHQQELIGRLTVKVTYVLHQAGEITIPALHVPWFNTKTGREEVASLPARTLHVALKSGAVAQENKPQPSVVNERADSTKANKPMAKATAANSGNQLGWWFAGIFAVAWVITLFIWWLRFSNSFSRQRRHALRQLHDACVHQDPALARQALLHWAKLIWPDAKLLNLNDLTKHVRDPEFTKQIHLLSQVLYSQDKKQSWQGFDLWRCVSRFRYKSRKTRRDQGLPPINPT